MEEEEKSQRSPWTASQQSCEWPRCGGLGRGAVPQRLIGSSPCHCVTSSRLAIKTAADATKGFLCTVKKNIYNAINVNYLIMTF